MVIVVSPLPPPSLIPSNLIHWFLVHKTEVNYMLEQALSVGEERLCFVSITHCVQCACSLPHFVCFIFAVAAVADVFSRIYYSFSPARVSPTIPQKKCAKLT